MPDRYSNYDRDEQRRNERTNNEGERFRDDRLPAHYREQEEGRRNRENQGELAGRQFGSRDYEPDTYGRDVQYAGRNSGQDWSENRNREWRDDRENWRARQRSGELLDPESQVTARISDRERDQQNRERNYDRDRSERNPTRNLDNTSREFNANNEQQQYRNSARDWQNSDWSNRQRDWDRNQQANWNREQPDWSREQQSNLDRERHPLWNRDERNRAWMREAQRHSNQSENSDWNRDRDWNRNRDWDRERGEQYGNRQYIESRGYDQYRAPNEYSNETMNETLTERVGRFMGVGPKGYRRSDERIREDVSERLEDHPAIDASNIEVSVKDGEVTLTGSVDNRQAKRLAEDVAAGGRGVKDVNNQIRVTSERQASGERQNVQRESGKTGRDRVA